MTIQRHTDTASRGAAPGRPVISVTVAGQDSTGHTAGTASWTVNEQAAAGSASDDKPLLAAPPQARLADRYRLVELIAAGGMGQVWRAQDMLLGRPVAVKMLRNEDSGDPARLAQFRTEAHHAASLSHPNIAAVFDYGEMTAQDGTGQTLAYLVMELVDGEPLAALLRREGRLDPATTLALLGQAAAALGEAHRAGLVHRDVKPANLLIRRDGQVKVTDFGIAAPAATRPPSRTRQLIGTPQYLSPEQAAGQPATPASDVYALGLVGYECLTGHPAFAGANPITVAVKHLREQPDPLPTELPGAVQTLIGRALAKDPAERLPDGAAFATAIDHAATGRALPPLESPNTDTVTFSADTTPPPGPQPTTTTRQHLSNTLPARISRHAHGSRWKRRLSIAAVGAGLVVSGGGSALALWGHPVAAPLSVGSTAAVRPSGRASASAPAVSPTPVSNPSGRASVAAPAPSPTPASCGVPAPASSGVDTKSGSTADFPPIRLQISAIQLNTSLIPLDLHHDGTIAVPRDFTPAGWYDAGTRPGDPGPAVILGDVDSYRGPAVFYRLRQLRPGDVLSIERLDRSTVRFAVDASRNFPRNKFPTDLVYGDTTDPTLRLITCGGAFDGSTGGYLDNEVVFAHEL